MDRKTEIKNQAVIIIYSILGSMQSERTQRLESQIHGLIDEAYEAGQNDTVQKILAQGRTLGGSK